jgi:hypothetical protein
MFGWAWISAVGTRVLLVAAVVLFVATLPARAQDPGVLRIPAEKWQFHIGDDPRCATGNNPGCIWQPQLPSTNVGDQTYWKHVEIMLPGELANTPQLALLVQDEPLNFEVYANGHLIGGTAPTSFFRAGANARRILTFPASIAPYGYLSLTVRVFPQWRAPGMRPPIGDLVAPADRIQAIKDAETLAYLRTGAMHYLCFAAVGFAAFVFLLLYSVNVRLKENLWLGLILAAVSSLRLAEISHVADISMPVWLSDAIFQLGNGLTAWFLVEFIFSFLSRPVPKAFRLVQIVGLGDIYLGLGLPIPAFLAWYIGQATVATILVASLTQLLMLPTCFRSKLPEMRWIGASILFITVENSARMAKQLNLPSPTQDVMWHGLDIDVRGISYVLFALVMLVAMTFRLRRIQDRNREIEGELAAARSVQQILIPEELPSIPGLAVESAYLPAQQVGGDFFQLLPIGEVDLLLVVGDVSGKGLPAAMLVSVLVGAIRSTVVFTQDPAELLAHLNERLVGRAKGGGFSTAVAAFIARDGSVTIANAGHLSPYLDGKEIELANALPLGIVSGTTYESSQFQLRPGSRLTFYSDGVVEAQNEKGELFGFERGQRISTRPAAQILEAAKRFGQSDDITVVTIERLAAGAESAARRVEPVLAPA